RTVDLMGISLRLGGFEIRDCLQWLYGSGFPKSLDVSKAIDKMAGAEREVLDRIRRSGRSGGILGKPVEIVREVTVPATPEAKQWEGWGTALKPAVEPIILARKPLSEATVADNVLKWGTGGLNIDGCRIDAEPRYFSPTVKGRGGILNKTDEMRDAWYEERGRFPANILLDEEAAKMLDGQQGGASRFFYVAKASRSERTMGGKVENNHPTVKPIKLMRYLCRLITPPGGTVLDPFAGSGTTLLAAIQEGFSCIGIEREPEYCDIIRKRMAAVQEPLPLRGVR